MFPSSNVSSTFKHGISKNSIINEMWGRLAVLSKNRIILHNMLHCANISLSIIQDVKHFKIFQRIYYNTEPKSREWYVLYSHRNIYGSTSKCIHPKN